MARLRISSTAESRVRPHLDEAEATSLKAAWEGMAPTPNHEASIGIYPAIAPTRLVVSDIAGVARILARRFICLGAQLPVSTPFLQIPPGRIQCSSSR